MPALSVRNLSVSFVERTLFSDVSFDVETHDKVGFIGALSGLTASEKPLSSAP